MNYSCVRGFGFHPHLDGSDHPIFLSSAEQKSGYTHNMWVEPIDAMMTDDQFRKTYFRKLKQPYAMTLTDIFEVPK